MIQVDPIRIETSMGEAQIIMVAPMQWEIVYPWGEDEYFCGMLGTARARIERRVERLERPC